MKAIFIILAFVIVAPSVIGFKRPDLGRLALNGGGAAPNVLLRSPEGEALSKRILDEREENEQRDFDADSRCPPSVL